MQQSPITDKTLGIPSAEKFREVKQRAKDEEFIRKTKRNKQEISPTYKIGELVVITRDQYGDKPKHYQLVEIIDIDIFSGAFRADISYFAVILKTTHDSNARIGRLIKFDEHKGWGWNNWKAANVVDENIKWKHVLPEENNG